MTSTSRWSATDTPAWAPIGRARIGVAAVFFLNGFGYGSWVPRVAEIQQALGLSEGQLGIALLMIAIGSLLAMVPIGGLLGRFGTRRVTRVAVFWYPLSLVPIGLAGDLWSLAAAFFVMGAAGGALDVAMNAQGVTVERRKGQPVMASFHGMFSVGAMAGAGASGLIAGAGIGLAAHLGGIALLMLAAGLAAGRPMLPHADDPGGRGALFARPTRGVLILGIIGLCALLVEGAVGDWSSVYISGELGAGTGMAAIAYAAFAVTMAAGRFAGDRLIARLGGPMVVRLGGALAALGLAGTLALGDPAVAVLGFALIGLGIACVFPVALMAAARANEQQAGPAIATVCTVGYFGFLIGPPAIGGLAELIGLTLALGLVVGLCLLMSVLSPALASNDPAGRGSGGSARPRS